MDGAILVVAATDGQMPQTREHLLLANQVLCLPMPLYCAQNAFLNNFVVIVIVSLGWSEKTCGLREQS